MFPINLMHGSILSVTIPPPRATPGDLCAKTGVGNFIDHLVPGVKVGNIYNYAIYYIIPECDGLDLACEPSWSCYVLLHLKIPRDLSKMIFSFDKNII